MFKGGVKGIAEVFAKKCLWSQYQNLIAFLASAGQPLSQELIP